MTNKYHADMIDNIEKHGILARGQKELIAHLNDGKLSLRQAVYARCYDCNGYYVDGKEVCTVTNCPLYPFMPYNPNRKKRAMSDKQKGNLNNTRNRVLMA